jgi:1,4-alpha-glucan branching enzyme
VPKISLSFLLNAHLPFVRRIEEGPSLEERWLFEALSETYLPLFRAVERLESDRIPYALTIALSPTLISMLGDPLLNARYRGYLDEQSSLAASELARIPPDDPCRKVAQGYADRYRRDIEDFEGRFSSLALTLFKELSAKKGIELMVSAATNAFLPAYAAFPAAIATQIELALQTFRAAFGSHPKGFWIPQLGWFKGLEDYLKAYNFEYTVLSTQGALHGDPTPLHGSFAPVSCANGMGIFIRDAHATGAVWSEREGYPSDPRYRDFYRDIGFDLPVDALGSHVGPGGERLYTGFKYMAIGDGKRVYDPEAGAAKAKEHAENFVYSRLMEGKKALKYMKRSPLVVCPYDAELFGHWWFEGIAWLERVFRVAANEPELECKTLSHALVTNPPTQTCDPDFSTWGEGGFARPWIDGNNDWVYRHTFKAVERMIEIAERFPDESGLKERILNQAAREAMLALASDWPFLLRAGTSVDYAKSRIEEHVGNFTRIYEMLCGNTVGTEWITKLEKKNNVFPTMNYRVFRKKR